MNPDVSLLATRVLSGDMKLHEALARLSDFKDKALLMRWFHSKQLTGRSLKKSLRGDLWVRVDVPDLIKGYHHDRMKNPKNWSEDSKGNLTYKVGGADYRIVNTEHGYAIYKTKPGSSERGQRVAGMPASTEDGAIAAAAQHRKATWYEQAPSHDRASQLSSWEKMDHAPLDWDDGVTNTYAAAHGLGGWPGKSTEALNKYRDRGASFARHRGSQEVSSSDLPHMIQNPDHRHSTLYAVHQRPNGRRWTLSIHPHRYNNTDVENHSHGFASKEAAQRAAAEHARGTRARAFEEGLRMNESLGFGGYQIEPARRRSWVHPGKIKYRIYDRGAGSAPDKRWGMHMGHPKEDSYSERRPVVSHHATRKEAHAAAMRHIRTLNDYHSARIPIGSPKDSQAVIHKAEDQRIMSSMHGSGMPLNEADKLRLTPSEFHVLRAVRHHKEDSGGVRRNKPQLWRVIKSLGRAPRASRDRTGHNSDALYRGTSVPEEWLRHFESVGNKFHAGHAAPWSESLNTTKSFVHHGDGKAGLIFHLKNPKYGTKISHIYDYDNELEHVTGGNFRITKVIGKDAEGHHNVEIEHLPKAEQPKGWHTQHWDMHGTKPPPSPAQLSLKLEKAISEGEWVPQEISDYLAEALLQRPPKHIRRLASIDRHISKAWVAGMDDYEADGADPNSPDSAHHGKPLRGPYGEPLKETQKLREAAKRIKNN